MSNDRRGVLRHGLEACITGAVDALPELFTDDVSGWSPNMLVSSLDELKQVVADHDDSLSDVSVDVNALDVFGDKGVVEYRVNATFSGPFVISEDAVIPPNGRRILLGGALVAEFSGDRISGFRNYFDDAALIDQMMQA